jgi:hypothetical protein
MPFPVKQGAVRRLTRSETYLAANARRHKCVPMLRDKELEMKNVNGKSIHLGILARVLFFGALAMCLTTTPLLAQDAIGGKFTLNENARLGNTVLGAGQYHFVIEPVGTIQSMRSIEQGAGHLVLVVVKAEKAGPTVSIFAMASQSDRGSNASELVLSSEKQETLARTLYLEKEKLVVDFNWSSPKAKSQVVAQQVEPQQSAAASRAGGNY